MQDKRLSAVAAVINPIKAWKMKCSNDVVMKYLTAWNFEKLRFDSAIIELSRKIVHQRITMSKPRWANQDFYVKYRTVAGASMHLYKRVPLQL